MSDSAKTTFIEPALVEPHYSTRIYKGYLMALEKKLGIEAARAIVSKTGVPWDYLTKDSNWVSETFADRFYDLLSLEPSLGEECSYDAGTLAMSEEAQGPVHILAMQLMEPMSIYQKIVFFTRNFNRVDSIEIKTFSSKHAQFVFKARRKTKHMGHITSNWKGFLESVPLLIGLPAADFKILPKGKDQDDNTVTFEVKTASNIGFVWLKRCELFFSVLAVALAGFWLGDLSDAFRAGLVATDVTLLFLLFLASLRIKEKIHGTARSNLKSILKETEDRYDELFQSKLRLDRRYKEANLLASVIQRISHGQDASTLISTTITEIKSSLEYDRVIYMGFNAAHNTLSTLACIGFEPQQLKLIQNYEIDLSRSTDNGFHLGNVFKGKQNILVPVSSDYFNSLSEEGKMMLYITKSKSFLACSVATEKNGFGVLLVDYSGEQKTVNKDDLHIIQNVSNQLAICLENAATLHLERKLRIEFQSYVPPKVISSLMGETTDSIEEGSERDVTILFSDIRQFTTRSGETNPKLLVETINEYFREMTDIVYSHGGIVDKFLGDGLLAVFNAFGDSEDHALKAVKAAYEMQRKMPELNQKIHETLTQGDPNWNPLEIGIAIHTGRAVMGNLGTKNKREFTAIGETVNVASRLVEFSKKHHASIILSPEVKQLTENHFQIESLGVSPIRGLQREMEIFLVHGERLVARVIPIESRMSNSTDKGKKVA